MYNQQMVQNKPTAAFVLALLAGIFGLILAMYFVVAGMYIFSAGIGALADYGFSVGYGDFDAVLAIYFAIVIWFLVSSILVLVGGVKVHSHPADHTKWGAIILVFSIIGFGPLILIAWFFGIPIFILGLVGGILALAFKPVYAPQQPPYGYQQQPYQPQGYAPPGYSPQQQVPYQQPYQSQQPYAQQQIKRICPQCGRVVDENLRFCPNCGKQLG